jgi:hypothetical protein
VPALKVWVANERLTSADLNATFASVQQPDGVAASAAANMVQTTPIPLTTVVEGKASYLAGGRIVTPRAGLYLVSGVITLQQATAGAFMTFSVPSTPIDFSFQNQAGTTGKFVFALPCVLASGVQLTGQFSTLAGGGAPSCTIHRLGFLFLGTGYAP